ncbi:MAG: cobalt ECF transporter T component CbiQ [Anaerolineaceae bacterium]|nr:cobalt ECF transporter T component CbiQ [Anaerolineaceae bacterium]
MIPNYFTLFNLDPRVKIIFTLGFLITLNLIPSGAWAAYILYAAFVFSIAIAARVPMKLLLKKSMISFVLIFSVFPLIFTGPAPFHAIEIASLPFQISIPGMIQMASITIKAWLSILAALLLSNSTPFPRLLMGFQQLHVPGIFIAIVNLMWRYLFVIRSEAGRLMHARASRSISLSNTQKRSGRSFIWRAKVTGGMAGNLFLRSLERADRVYAAMLARGYNGQIIDPESQPLEQKEKMLLIGSSLLLLLLTFLGFLTGVN